MHPNFQDQSSVVQTCFSCSTTLQLQTLLEITTIKQIDFKIAAAQGILKMTTVVIGLIF